MNCDRSSGRIDRAALSACLGVSFLFGMLHTFSLYVVPLEAAFGAGRGAVSLCYSLAIICLALTVLWGHRFYGRVAPSMFCAAVLVLGAAGLCLAAVAPALWVVWLGYGAVFGVANGFGYGFALQFSARVWPARGGWAMGLVTAAYALGASATPPVLAAVLGGVGWDGAFLAQAGLYVVAVPVVVWALRGCKMGFEPESGEFHRVRWWDHWRVWLAYGTAVFAGLMVLSQSSEIVREAGGIATLATAAPMVAAGANLVGSLGGGWAADRLSARVLLALIPVGTVLASGIGVLGGSAGAVLMAVGLVGFFYGATIAAYPAVIARMYPGAVGIAVYGVVFTAWGVAGVLAPWSAGALFDGFGGYGWALGIAAVLAIGSVGLQLFAVRDVTAGHASVTDV